MSEDKEKEKKNILLRLPYGLWEGLASWAEDEFRSINSQIEYILTESLKQKRKGKKK